MESFDGPEPPVRSDKVYIDDGLFVGSATKKGRPRKTYNKTQLEEVLRLYFLERLSIRKVARIMGLSHMSVYRLLSDPEVELLL